MVRFAVVVGLAFFSGLTGRGEQAFLFTDVSPGTGIDFRHSDGHGGQRFLMEAVSCGLATFDFDGDGLVDIYFINGAPLRGTQVDQPPRNALYRNLGNFRFVDVTDAAGVGDIGFGLGVTVADYDNDGFPDIYVNNYGENVFYRNQGDGTFAEVTGPTGTANGEKVGAGVAFLDINGNGLLDLYCANYIQFSYADYRPTNMLGHVVYPGPLVYPAEPDNLFRNNGDGTFTDVSEEAGVSVNPQWGMGVICGDFDGDGHTDIFVCNDSTRNFLFVNDGQGKFREMGLLSGLAFDGTGSPQGSMGVDVADYNGNGRLDLFMTTYQRERTTLYENLGGLLFQDVTARTGAGVHSFRRVNWGVGFGDFDNDGHVDLFVANGHIHDNVDKFDSSTSYGMPNQLLRNDGSGRFRDVTDGSGAIGVDAFSSRGAVLEDFDNDGRLDVVVLNSRRAPQVFRNEQVTGHHWIQLRLVGIDSNRDAVGARVRLTAGGRTQTKEIHSGRGYQSHFGSRLHFGLGDQSRIDEVEIRWVGGRIQRLGGMAADQILTVVETVEGE